MSQSDEQGATSRRGGVWRRSLRWATGLLALLFVGSYGLTAAEAEEAEQMWQERQHDLLKLSATSRLITAEQSNHSIVYLQPDIVVTAVQELVADFREATK